MKIIENLLFKSAFPKVESVLFEAKKNSLARILAGIIIFIRYWQIENAFHIYNGYWPLLLTLYLTLCFLLIIGFMTPIVILTMMFLSHFVDTEYGTVTLGTTILTELMLVLLFGGAGYYFSLDRYLINRKRSHDLGRNSILEKVYSFFRFTREKDLMLVYFVAFLLYAVSSFTALYLHIKDDYWVGGLTTKSLLSSAYLCYFWEYFRGFENNHPILISFLSICGSIFQSIFQFLMVFLIWKKWGRMYVFVWGMIFFLISFIFINLSYLPHLEIIMWLIIFVPVRINKNQIKIYFDDKCNLCQKAMRVIHKLNYNNSVVLKPISENIETLEQSGFTIKEIKAYMVGSYKNKYYKGYDLYMFIILKNPIYWILLPVFCLGYLFGVGKRIYNYVAENRYKHFGQCELADPNSFINQENPINIDQYRFIKHLFIVVYMILIPTFFVIKIVRMDFGTEGNYYIGKFYKNFGMELPDVFNKTDLSMGDKWAVIYRVNPTNKEPILTPVIGKNGERLNYSGINWLYLSNHNTDYLYFGATLGYARNMIKIKDINKMTTFHTEGAGMAHLKKRVIYDYNYNHLSGSVTYKAQVCSSSSSQVIHWTSDPNRHTVKVLMIFECEYNGKEFKIKQTNENII